MKKLIFCMMFFMLVGCKQNTKAQKIVNTKNSEAQIDILEKQFDSIEKQIGEKQIGEFQKKIKDLDGDGDDDFIYLYQCGEPQCIDVYINLNKNIEKVISELCYEYLLSDNEIQIKRNHCCGESPYTSIRKFNFEKDKAILNDNYVLFNASEELLSPKKIMSVNENYNVIIKKENYNVRFSPNIKEYKEEESYFSCEENTNIIGKLKEDSTVMVLSEIETKERTWLFVEINDISLNEACTSPINFENENQKLRAWISNKFTEKSNKN